LHMGDLGQPIVEAHLGGVMGGLVAFMILMLSGSFSTLLRKSCKEKQENGDWYLL